MKDNNSKQVLLSVLGVAILVVAVVGVSFAAFSYSKTGEKVNTITTGTITMSYTDVTNGINIQNAMPMSDEQGKTLTGENNVFDFNVSATISGSGTTQTKSSSISATTGSPNTEDDYVLKSGTFSGTGGSDSYRLRMWVDYNAPSMAGDVASQLTYRLKVNVYGKAAAQ